MREGNGDSTQMATYPYEAGRAAGTGGGVNSIEDATRVVLRPIANPLPLGFLALGAATLLVSGLQLGWLHASQGNDVALILLAFVFPLQLITSIFGYLGRDVVVGTG